MKYITWALFILTELSALGQTKLSQKQTDRMEKLISDAMEKQQIPGFSIAVAIDSQIVWQKGLGFADIKRKIPVTPTTKFRIASIGKPMTATAIMQLYNEHKLELDRVVQDYVPDFPAKKWPVTIRNLLTHQSGIRFYESDEIINKIHYTDVCHALRIFAGDSLLSQPGTRYQYTSFNYNLLGCIIQYITGTSYASWMQRAVFEPAGMLHTVVDDSYKAISARAKGYIYDTIKHSLVEVQKHDPSDRLPAGGFLTTAHDLARFAISSYNGRLLPQNSFQEMITWPKMPDSSLSLYGFGWGLFDPDDKFHGYTEVFHGGGTPGVSNMLSLFLSPQKKVVIAFMTNLQGMSQRSELAEQLAAIVLGIKE